MWQCECGQENLGSEKECGTCGATRDDRALDLTAAGGHKTARRVEAKPTARSAARPTERSARHPAPRPSSATPARTGPPAAVVRPAVTTSAPTAPPISTLSDARIVAFSARDEARPANVLAWLVGAALIGGAILTFAPKSQPHTTVSPSPSFTPPAMSEAISEAQPAPLYEASFDCSRGTAWDEMQVCQDPTLAGLDKSMADLYAQRLGQSGDEGKLRLRNAQRTFLRERGNCSEDVEGLSCLRNLYQRRLSELQLEHDEDTPLVRSPRAGDGAVNTPAAVQPSSGVTCVLPSGEVGQLPYEVCRQRAGVIYADH